MSWLILNFKISMWLTKLIGFPSIVNKCQLPAFLSFRRMSLLGSDTEFTRGHRRCQIVYSCERCQVLNLQTHQDVNLRGGGDDATQNKTQLTFFSSSSPLHAFKQIWSTFLDILVIMALLFGFCNYQTMWLIAFCECFSNSWFHCDWHNAY